MPSKRDKKYFDIVIEPLRVCKSYRPKLGHGGKDGYSLKEFRQFYGSDPFYKWMGLDMGCSPLSRPKSVLNKIVS